VANTYVGGARVSERICIIPKCGKTIRCRGLCPSHYARWLRTGIAESQALSESERFWSRVHTLGVCWEWTAGTNHAGYGTFRYHGGYLAHRYAFEVLVGPIPDGLVLDHLCRNPPCVNPDHLEVVTLAENVRRGVAGKVAGLRHSSKTHCPAGHEYTPDNTYVVPGKGSRRCKKCHAARVADAYRRTKHGIRQ
jgi:hypothetical protein